MQRAPGYFIRTFGLDQSACTEAEMHWTGVLRANGRHKASSTNDYVHLAKTMKLKDYRIVFRKYPQLKDFRPFVRWQQAGKPSQDIPWYQAYNDTKHDREQAFRKATLGHAFNAVAACAIMLVAQFGRNGAIEKGSDLSRYFEFSKEPVWDYEDYYVACFEPPQNDWLPTNYVW